LVALALWVTVRHRRRILSQTQAARLGGQAVEEATKLAQILDLTRDIGGSLDLDHVLERVARPPQGVGSVPEVRLWSAGEDGLRPVYGRGADPGFGDERPDEVLSSAAANARTRRAPNHQRGGCAVAVPMVYDGHVLGVLDLRGEEAEALDDPGVSLVETLA